MRCYVHPDEWSAELPVLDEAASHHLVRVLRVRVGDAIDLFNGEGGLAEAELVEVKKRRVTARVLRRHQSAPLVPALTLVQALIRPHKMDWIFQKAAELGASAIIPIRAERCVSRAPDKPERWRRIVVNAAEQCGTDWLPTIHPVASFEEVLASCPEGTQTLIGALTGETVPLRTVWERGPVPTRILIGPEGDFTPEEMVAALDAGAIPVRMGPLTLRAETAGLAALSALTCAWR